MKTIITLTDQTANLVAEQNFDAWGRLRNPNNWTYTNPAPLGGGLNWLSRGFTGHEHLFFLSGGAGVGSSLINMNGRMYDPLLARMLSPDNFVQNTTGTQGFNRYSYVVNNPLKFTDPSGESAESIARGFIDYLTFPARVISEGVQWLNDKINGVHRDGGYFNSNYLEGNAAPSSTQGGGLGLPSNSNNSWAKNNGFTDASGDSYTEGTYLWGYWWKQASVNGKNIGTPIRQEPIYKMGLVLADMGSTSGGGGLDWKTTTDVQKILHIMNSIRYTGMKGGSSIDMRQLFANFPGNGSGVNLISGIKIGDNSMIVHMNLAIYKNMQIDIYPARIGQVGPFNGVNLKGVIKEGYWDMMELNRAGGNIPMLMIQINANFDTFYNYLYKY